MTHLFDSSASLAGGFGEPGMERVRALLNDPGASVGVSVLTLFETYTRVFHVAGSHEAARQAVTDLRQIVSEIVPLSEEIVDLAMDLRRFAHLRVNVTVTTDSDAVRKRFEPACPSIERRLDALRGLKAAGIKTGACLIPFCPLRTPTPSPRPSPP